MEVSEDKASVNVKKKRHIRTIGEHIQDLDVKIVKKEKNIEKQQKELEQLHKERQRLCEQQDRQTLNDLARKCKDRQIKIETIIANLDIFADTTKEDIT